MAQLAIKGHGTRGKEVIEILEMLGGKQFEKYLGNDISWCYTIIDGKIEWDYPSDEYKVFTLEEFLEKFPYKIGDKVLINDIENDVYTIKTMVWDEEFNRVNYGIEAVDGIMDCDFWHADEMVFFKNKKETMEENLKQIILEIPDGYEFFGINDDNKVVLTKKQPQYPKTYEECAKELGYNQVMPADHILGYRGTLLSFFQQLLICRDAYWKIAGEQMGLGKPWEPYWTIYKHKFCLGTDKDKVIEECVTTGNRILAFPTEEMRDAFYENFKELIENCKELL